MFPELTPEDLDEMIEDHEDLVILDVRNPDEFRAGHIPGAHNQPYAAPGDQLPAGVEGKTIVLYSNRGERSARAAQQLTALGVERVYSLSGGIARWGTEGWAVVRELP